MKLFNQNARTRVPRNKFNLSHERKLSLNMGELIPILLEEIVPGDKFKVSSEIMMRLAPMIAPIMHRVNVYTHYFFVPNRIVWNEWESFITGGRQGDELPVSPYIGISETTKNLFGKGMLGDYFGIPPIDQSTVVENGIELSVLPYRGYAEIFNEYYQDQNLSTPIAYDKGSGSQTWAEFNLINDLQKRAWEKDYFTSALPWSQRGGDVTMPVTYSDHVRLQNQDGSDPTPPVTLTGLGSGEETWLDGNGNWMTMDNIDGITVNDLRRSVRLQEWLEKTARGGSRYIEQILSHFGIKSSDARLQRPEYLGGGVNPVVISEVLNTAGDPAGGVSAVVGDMAGHGVSVGNNFAFNKSFEEHGYVFGIMSVLPKTTYQQGIERHWTRKDKFDYYFPEFANLGEQEIKNQEIYAQYDAAANREGTFGYQSRFAEYKFKNSSVHSDFRDTLDFWHMGRKFDALPALNQTFIESDPTTRIFAVEDEQEDKLYCQIYNNVSALRPMPYFGTPTL